MKVAYQLVCSLCLGQLVQRVGVHLTDLTREQLVVHEGPILDQVLLRIGKGLGLRLRLSLGVLEG